MKRVIFISIVFLLVTGGMTIAEERKGEPQYLVKMASIIPEIGPAMELVSEMKKELLERTQGRLGMMIYFGGVMGDEPDIVRKMRLGQLQGGAFLTLIGLGQICPAAKVLELPFLFNSNDEVDHIVFNMQTAFSRLFEEKGAYLVSWGEIGFGRFFFKNPVKTIEDIKKVKMTSFIGDPVFSASEKAAGFGNLIPLTVPEVLTGLQTGLVNGALNPAVGLVSLQWNTQVNYVLNVPFAYSPAGTVVDKKFFDQLPRELREVFFDVWKKREVNWIQIARKMEKEAYEGLVRRGMIEIDKENSLAIVEEMKKGTQPLYDKFIGEYYPAWLLSEILNSLAQYRQGKGAK